MGITNSCLPISVKSSVLKLKYERQEPINNNPININQATEDELLLLPGITRQTAENILQYREVNKGFKQIKELCQVSGVTYEIYRCIHCDITINSSLRNKHELVNLNSASYNELCTLPGLTPNLVSKIIKRRERKGLFSFIDDLLKIKGINYVILSTIRPHVTVNQQQQTSHRYSIKTHSLASILLETLPPELQNILLSSSPPQRLSSDHHHDNNKQKTFRFASWNLQQLTTNKAQNPGVKEVICRVILENNFSLIGIQEIGNKDSLEYIIQELNNPTIPSIKHCHHGKWQYIISDIAGRISEINEYLGFIYDESVGIELKKSSLLSLTYFSRLPYLTIFRICNKIELVFVNTHLKSRGLNDEAESLEVLIQTIKDTVESSHIIIFGSFNVEPTALECESFVKSNYSCVTQQNTNISLKMLQGSACADNIWLSTEVKGLSTGNSGIIRENLTSMWIPTGWSWGGLVSDHCPIWIELNLS